MLALSLLAHPYQLKGSARAACCTAALCRRSRIVPVLDLASVLWLDEFPLSGAYSCRMSCTQSLENKRRSLLIHATCHPTPSNGEGGRSSERRRWKERMVREGRRITAQGDPSVSHLPAKLSCS